MRMTIKGYAAQACTTPSPENILEWVRKDKRRLLRVVYCVEDLERTIKLYTECLGMKLLRKHDIPEENIQMFFLDTVPKRLNLLLNLLT
ncbi:hypothetical protein Csa_022661, partial [Cucumis sativus]